MSSCWGADSELVEQLVAQREVGGGQSDQGSYQVSLGDPAAEQPANVQGELVEVSGGIVLKQHGELAGWGASAGVGVDVLCGAATMGHAAGLGEAVASGWSRASAGRRVTGCPSSAW